MKWYFQEVAPRRVGLRLGDGADAVRHAGERAAGEGAVARQQERVAVPPEPRDRPGQSIRSKRCRCRPRRAPGEHPWPTQPFPFTASGKLMEPLVRSFRPWTSREGSWRRASRPFRSSSRQGRTRFSPYSGQNYGPAAYSPRTGSALRERDRRAEKFRPGPEGRVLGVRSDDRRAEVASEVRWLRPGRPGGHCQRHRVRGRGLQLGRVLLRVRRQDRGDALEVQHRVRRVLVARRSMW